MCACIRSHTVVDFFNSLVYLYENLNIVLLIFLIVADEVVVPLSEVTYQTETQLPAQSSSQARSLARPPTSNQPEKGIGAPNHRVEGTKKGV